MRVNPSYRDVIRYLVLVALSVCLPLFKLSAEELHFSDRVPEKRVGGIRFSGWSGLDRGDLMKNLAFAPGEILSTTAIQRSVEALYQRDIFDHIDVSLHEQEKSVDVEFLCSPAMFVFELQFHGFNALPESALKRLAGIRLGERLRMEELLEAQRRIREGYAKAGYFDPTVKIEIRERSLAPQVLVDFQIEEGYLGKISKIALIGTLPDDVAKLQEKLDRRGVGAPASAENIRNLRREFLAALRKEGYLQASVEIEELQRNPLSGDVVLPITVYAREPLSLVFQGNRQFSPKELLEPLKMETRTVPFTPSAIQTLCREIEKIYEADGYFFAHVETQELPQVSGRKNFLIRVEEGKRMRLRKILFEGNAAIRTQELRRVMQTQPAGPLLFRRWNPGFLRKAVLSSDLAAIEAYYRDAGYVDAKISFDLVSSNESGGLELHIQIIEGPQATLSEASIVWKGLDDNDRQTEALLLATPLEIKAGDPWRPGGFHAEAERMTQKIVRQGFPNVHVEFTQDENQRSILYTITPGQQVTIGEVALTGNAFTHDFLISRELKLHPRHLFRPEDIEQSEQNLYRTGFFKSVEIIPADGALDQSVENMLVRVSERDTGMLQLGGAVNSEDGLHIFSEIGQRNLDGQGQALVMGVDGFVKGSGNILDAGTARIRFTQPHIFESETTLVSEAFAQYSIQLIDPYSYDRVGVSSTLRLRPFQLLTGDLGATAYSENLYDVPSDVEIGASDSGHAYYAKVMSRLDLDARDNPYNPRSGYRALLQTQISTEVLGSRENFVSLNLQQSVYVPVATRLVWANNLRMVAIEPFAGSQVVPLSERLFLGGRDSLRGFSKNAVGPRGSLGNIVGGDTGVNASSELQLDVTENTVVLVFLDAGQAFLRNKGAFSGKPPHIGDLRFSPGLGFRYKTPIGPVSAEYGVALDRENGERLGRFNFGIGGAF